MISRRAQRVGPERHVRIRRRGPHRDHVGVALRVDPARERVAGVAEAAAAGLAGIQQPERQRRGMQAQFAHAGRDARHPGRVRHRRERIRPARRLGRIVADRAAHLVQSLGPIVVRRQRVVVDRPRRRHAVGVLQRLEILAAQPVQHAAPELGVAADVVVRVGLEFAAAFVEPALRASGSADPSRPRRRSSSRLPAARNRRARGSGCRAPVGASACADGPAAGAAADDDDVEVLVHVSRVA